MNEYAEFDKRIHLGEFLLFKSYSLERDHKWRLAVTSRGNPPLSEVVHEIGEASHLLDMFYFPKWTTSFPNGLLKEPNS